ncbi:hypothetical protein AVEN_97960-1 [Araneus ventricosus]|uniref:Uncharacterized protein n=1 Tax=Araneus ventricosus TaxID=182803 RepID=A0A4Y2MPB6_ARAVE|nr:hypothetical protein AVEN_97960-1 [Araneus ventricosus]
MLKGQPRTSTTLMQRVPEADQQCLILSRPAEWLGYQPMDTPGTKMYHLSIGCCRNGQHVGEAIHEEQEANRVATAPHMRAPAYPRGKEEKKQKTGRRGEKNQKVEVS